MVRQLSVILGIGTLILWIAELSVNVAPWLTWLDFVAAICALVVAATVNERSPRSLRIGAPIGIALGLFVMWIVALAGGSAPAWQVWWNFGFACAFLLTGLGATAVAAEEIRGGTFDRHEAALPGNSPSDFYGYGANASRAGNREQERVNRAINAEPSPESLHHIEDSPSSREVRADRETSGRDRAA